MPSNHKLFTFIQSILLLMLVQLCTDIYLPSIPAMCAALATSESLVKLSLTVMIIMLGLSQLLYGPLSDAKGRKPSIMIGLSIFMVGSLILISPPSVSSLITGRTIQGIGLGFGLCISSAIAADIYHGKTLNKAMSVLSVIYAIMPVIAPIIGGVFQTYLGWEFNFYFLFISGLITISFIAFCLKETNPNAGQQEFRLQQVMSIYWALLKSKSYTCNLLIAALFYTGEVSYVIQMPIVAQTSYHVSPLHTGWLVFFTSVAIMVGSGLSAILINKMAANTIIHLGIACAGLGCLLNIVLLSFYQQSLTIFIFPMIFFMLGSGFAFPNCMSNCLNLFPQKPGTGTASALALGLLTLLGGILTIIIAKIPAEASNLFSLFMCMITLAMFLVALVLSNKHTRVSLSPF